MPQHCSTKYRSPTVEQLTDYNERIRNLQEVSQDQDSCTPMAKLGKHMHIAAEQAFTLIPKNQRQSYIYIYISANTWNLLQAGQTALAQEQFNHAKDLTSKIKKAVREDKEKQLKEQLEEMEGNSCKWNGLKRLRARPRLKYTKFVDKYGKRIPRGEYHNKAAEYLAHEQWKGNQRNYHRLN